MERRYDIKLCVTVTVVIGFVMYVARNTNFLFCKCPTESGPNLNIKERFSPFQTTDKMALNERILKSKHTDLMLVEYKPITLSEGMSESDVAQAFKLLVSQTQIDCPEWESYGKTNKDWAVCRAKAYLPQKPCVIYSIGIGYDWSFDELYQKKYGCLVRTFDPTMGDTGEHQHKPGIPFYPVGLSGKKEIRQPKGWQMDTLKGLMARFKESNTTIPYLKFDIERSEWDVLENVLKDGSLKNVMQLSFELHVRTARDYRRCFELIKGLETIGFRRWYRMKRYGSHLYQMDHSYLNINFL